MTQAKANPRPETPYTLQTATNTALVIAQRASSWAHQNLFSSYANGAITLLTAWLTYLTLASLVDWALIRGVFAGQDGSACRHEGAGACWPFIYYKANLFIFGRYPEAERWRVMLTMALALLPIASYATSQRIPPRAYALFVFLVLPLSAFVLLKGGVFGLAPVGTELWGGLMLTLVIASVGIAAAFPLGVILALGRRSELPIVRWLSIAYIEFVRGVPLVTILFMSSVMLPLFLPPEVTIDKLLRALVGVALFSAAYLAEVIRGGLQAIPRGQFEAADALGLSYWQKMRHIVLPQALTLVIPGLVNSFISLFKDTSLVLIIGLFDLLGIVEQSVQADAKWFSPQTAATGYFFAGLIFWAFSFAISRASARLETRLNVTDAR